MLQSEYDVIVRNRRLKVLLIILTAIVVALVLYAVIKVGRDYLYKPTEPIITGVAPEATDISSPRNYPEPQRTDFGMNLPVGFPIDIPIEKDVQFTQSYSLDYPGQRQLSIVFLSTKTVKENFDLYKNYAEKDGWNTSSNGEKLEIAFVYATKERMEMNVMVNKDTSTPVSKSQVSISILRK